VQKPIQNISEIKDINVISETLKLPQENREALEDIGIGHTNCS
jgi:hypothetical protein